MAQNKEKMLVFTMSPEIALEFWERVGKLKVDNERERRLILLEMTKEGKMIGVSETTRTKEEYIESMAKEFKIIDISPDNKENFNDK